MFLRILNIHRKTPVLESNFCIIKKKLQQRYFPANITKILRTVFFLEHLYLKLSFYSIYPYLTPSALPPALYSTIFCSRYSTWNNIYIYAKPGSTPICGREFRLENAAIWSRAFGLGHTCGYAELSEV